MTVALLCAALTCALLSVAEPRLIRRYVLARRTRRDVRIALPGFIEAVGAGLAGGLSLELALAEVAASQPHPLDAAARRAAASLRLGARLDEALEAFSGSVAPGDLAPFAIVLSAFGRSGGRIGRSLDRVARLLRAKLAVEDERAALSAQGRASALVLSLISPLGVLFFAAATPDYLPTFLGPGRALLALAVCLEALGAAWLFLLVHERRGADDLPALLDAVIVGLDAGLTFHQSLAILGSRAPLLARPAARRLLADLALGRGPRAAYATFAAAGPNEARTAALVDAATRFGSPLATLLVAQADTLRERERRVAETRARRLPVLMLFPLTLCVLPAVLIVFLGPPLLSFLGE